MPAGQIPKLERSDLRGILRRLAAGAWIWEIAREFGVSERTVVDIHRGRSGKTRAAEPVHRCRGCGATLADRARPCLRCALLQIAKPFPRKHP